MKQSKVINWCEILLEKIEGEENKYTDFDLEKLARLWVAEMSLQFDDSIHEFFLDFLIHINNGEWLGAYRAYGRIKSSNFNVII